MLEKLKIQTPKSARRQIGDYVKDAIRSGELAVGSRLPPTQKLAKIWKKNPATVQAALTPLVKEGLLARKPGLGTFVTKRPTRLATVGIYQCHESRPTSAFAFQRAFHNALQAQLHRKKIATVFLTDTRPPSEQGRPWDKIARAVEASDIQALVATFILKPHIRWLRRLPVPTAFLTGENLPNHIGFDMCQFVELSLAALRKQGCRSAGLITPLSPAETTMDGSPHGNAAIFPRFRKAARALDMTVKESWICASGSEHSMGDEPQEHYGYRRFKQLWAQKEHPEGLVVYPDLTSSGVVTAILELQVSVPGDVKLALHRNAGVDILCPVPATLVVSDESEAADEIINILETQFRGETPKRTLVPFHVAK